MKKKIVLTFFVLLLSPICFSSCGKRQTQIHVHDRHGLSYDYVKAFAQAQGPITLVLLDYHHDINSDTNELTSYNWVGKLIEENYLEKVIWLSGKKLLLPNRNSRMDWLDRSLQNSYPQTVEKIKQAVELVDWYDLQKLKINSPFVITLDFDVFTKDPGDDPKLFVDELSKWIQKQKPELLTLAFSAAYQPKPQEAWIWFEQFIKGYKNRAVWFLESGSFGEAEESKEEQAAHELWKKLPFEFKKSQAAFYKGAYLWQNAPDSVVTALKQKKIKAGNSLAETIIKSWNDEGLAKLKNKFSYELLDDLCRLSKTSMQQYFNGTDFATPKQVLEKQEKTYGLAVRFRNKDVDRGCLALYRGVVFDDIPAAVQYCTKEAITDPRYPDIVEEEKDELFINLSIFDEWEEMSLSLDFEPGLHSLLLQTPDGEITLLQAAIALEREYSKEEFLQRLSNKAGLGLEGWKNPDNKYFRARTITFTLLSDSEPGQ